MHKPNPDSFMKTILVTPAMARRWLQNAENHKGELPQRKVDRRRVAGLVDDILHNAFRGDLGDPISLNADEVPLNGRHRLSAVVAAGVAVLLNVRFNVENEARAFFDRGKPRSCGQQIEMVHGVPHGGKKLAVLRGFHNAWYRTGSNIDMTDHEKHEKVEDATFRTAFDAVYEVRCKTHLDEAPDTKSKLKSHLITAAFAMTWPEDPGTVEAAYRQFLKGTGLDAKTHPLKRLRVLLQTSNISSAATRWPVIVRAVYAISQHLTGGYIRETEFRGDIGARYADEVAYHAQAFMPALVPNILLQAQQAGAQAAA